MTDLLAGPSFRRFFLQRVDDVNGRSGTGIVAYGAVVPTGRCFMQWRPTAEIPGGSCAIYDGLRQLIAIHGHEGRTVLQFLDPVEPLLAPELRRAVADEVLLAIREG
jgi:hypothetical protein